MTNYRILSTGNPDKKGIARELAKEFSNVDFLSVSKGTDLSSQEGQAYFKSIIKDYNVFVNLSNIQNNTQEKLLTLAHEAGMTGHIFNIGSICEYRRWEWYDPKYTAEKRQLRETSLDLCSEKFKTTHIVIGGFQDYEDDSPSRMDPYEVIKIIKYVLEAPINIPIIGLEKIIDKEMEEHLNGKI